MKVYVFTCHAAIDGEFLDAYTQPFEKKEDALGHFNEWKKDWVEMDGWSVDVNTEYHFETSVFGDYCNNHAEGFVEEFEI